MTLISIVIPTLNEVDIIRSTISHTIQQSYQPEEIEIIVVDAGSIDGTLESIKNERAQKFSKPEYALKKYESLNFGIEQCIGEVVLFLDADTLLPKHFDLRIREVLGKEKVVAGAFEFSFQQPDWKLLLLTAINRIRYRFGKIYYGDQAIFAKRKVLDQIGGVPEEALMEAAFLCKKLRKKGKLQLIKPGVATSPRRFNEYGFFKVAWFDINMFIRFNLGFPVSGYANKYWGKNLK